METTARGMSLERKLPLLMTGVLLVVLAAGVLVLDRELRRSAEVISATKLKENTIAIGKLIEGSGASFASAVRPFTRDNDVITVLRDPTPSRRTLIRVQNRLAGLENHSLPQDSGLVSELWKGDGTVLLRSGDSTAHLGRPAGEAVSTGPDAVSIGTFYSLNGRVYYWVTTPILDKGTRIGTLAQRRRVNSVEETEKSIRSLAGQSHIILLRNSNGSFWTTLGGRPVAPPTNPGELRGFPTFEHHDVVPNERVVLYSVESKGTPWGVALELPVSKLTEGPRDIVRRFELISLVLLILGAVAVWFISRRITYPLARMTVAAEAMARGDYSHRVAESGEREIARLGASFNRMATEVEAANRKLLDAADKAEKAQSVAEDANAAKANFLAAMSHELRTPLNAIAGYTQLLEMGIRGPLTPEQQTDLSRIKRSQEYLLGLIEQVLIFTQLEAHKVAIHVEDVRIDDVLRDAETMVKPQIEAKGIRFSYVEGIPNLIVRADRDKTQQILLNLITNGAKYTNPGGRVTVSARSRNGTALVSVADTGPGIPEQMLSHIFEPFVQLDRRLNQPREGVGLGLTISRDLARAMGGDLFVDSTIGVGSTFTLMLPRREAERTT
jgi:signal transduction histidine kinase